MLSQARKFGLNVYLACQSLSQIGKKRLSGAFENCKLGIFFALGQESAELSSRQIGDLDPYSIKQATGESDSHSPTGHDQYLPILDQVQMWTNELKNLTPRHCYVKADTAKPAAYSDTDDERAEGRQRRVRGGAGDLPLSLPAQPE